jgi:signal peptidase II
VTTGPGATPTAGGERRGRLGWLVFGALAAIVVLVDQATKAWVKGEFELASPHATPGTSGGPTQVVGDLVRVALSYNDGGIFGLLGASATALGLASLVVIAIIIVVQARQGRGNLLLTIALGLLLGGALGNLLDRFALGKVVDWVDMGIGAFRWYTFNVADAAISTAIVVLLVLGLFGHRLGRLGGTGTAASPSRSPAPGEPTGGLR